MFCRCLRPLRANSESAIAVVCFLFLIISKADSRSIAELLSEMELADSHDDIYPRRQQQQQQLQPRQQQQLFFGDDDVTAAVTKRSPWAQYEVNVDNLRQKIIRSKAFSNRQKHSASFPLPPTEKYHDTPSSSSSLVGGELEISSSPEDAYIDGYAMGWVKARAYVEEAGLKWPEVGVPDEDGNSAPYQFGGGDRYARSSRAWDPVTGGHPVYLGMGQETANVALSTFVSLLAEEEKRKNSEHPVRFIGKRRFATDE